MSLATLNKAAKKPSSLIRLALADLKKCEADPAYKIDMDNWHLPISNRTGSNTVCHVCFAGAVLAKTLGASPFDDVTPSGYLLYRTPDEFHSSETAQRIVSLNGFRRGYVVEAVYLGWYRENGHALDKVSKNILKKLRKAFPKAEFEGDTLLSAIEHKPLAVGGSYRTKDQRVKFRRNMADMARRLAKVGL